MAFRNAPSANGITLSRQHCLIVLTKRSARALRFAELAGSFTFCWKDYRHSDRPKTLTLDADESIRRFLLHLLPDGYQRIRHCGILSPRDHQAQLARCRRLLATAATPDGVVPPRPKPDDHEQHEKLTGLSLRDCPVCHQGRMVVIDVLCAFKRAPPGPNLP